MAKLVKTQYEIATIDDVKVTLDLSVFRKTEEIYFNATDMGKAFDKKPYEWLRLDETREYAKALTRAHPEFKVGSEPPLDSEKLVKIVRGKHGGTYLHKRLALKFARWCSADFEVALDDFLYAYIEEERKRKDARLEAKTGFRPLTDAIQRDHENPQEHHYTNEINMMYCIATGIQARKLKLELNVPKGKAIRDYLSESQMTAVAELQKLNTALIMFGKNYYERKAMLSEFYNTKLELLCQSII